MKSSKFFSVGLAALTALAVSTPNVTAHNPAKYTNIPFVVAGACQGGTANLVSTNGSAGIQCTVPDVGAAVGGFEVYCSAPGTGTLPVNAAGSFSQGTLTCNFTSSVPLLPSEPNENSGMYFVFNNAGTPIRSGPHATVSGNVLTLPCTDATYPNAPVICIGFAISGFHGAFTATFYNFRYNNSPLMMDTTLIDTSTEGSQSSIGNFCAEI